MHQGSVLSPLLFIIVLEALSHEFRTGCPWELLYVDDLLISDEDPVKLEEMLCTWKRNLESCRLRVNMGKIKMMISGPGLETLKDLVSTHVVCAGKALAATQYSAKGVLTGCTTSALE